jgi:hypothetical protein
MREAHITIAGLVLAGTLLGAPAPVAAGGQAAAPAPGVEVEALPVPDWLAWAVLHDSLAFYQQRAPAALDALLIEQTGLDVTPRAALLETGQVFAAALQSD